MRNLLAALLILAASAPPALAQMVKPFDMSTERGKEEAPAPPVEQQAQPTQPKLSVPRAPQPEAGKAVTKEVRRYLIPFPEMTLTGENDHRDWMMAVTAEQAASRTMLHLAYQNAVVVAPEYSRIRVTINNVKILDKPIESASRSAEIAINLPQGLLVAGANEIAIDAVMRHRTDCSTRSTYDLWTRIDPAGTFLTFDGNDAGKLTRLDEIAAIGVDPHGVTHFNIVAPAIDSAITISPVFKLAEGLALAAGMPNQSVEITRQPSPPAPGTLQVFVGTPGELASAMPNLSQGVSSPFAGFIPNPSGGNSALVVSGPTWQAIGSAVTTLTAPFSRAMDSPRSAINTQSWRSPDAPLFFGAGKAGFGEMGIPTQEFSGRRFHTDFAFGIPSDFYANGYGTATILLDAAYSPDVLPGSHIDVYVNGNIATTLPIEDGGGAILRHYPVKVTMRHFRPGVNVVRLEAVLRTKADEVCAPGATGSNSPRFVLFDTSQFAVPTFARIARLPDLSALAGTGFPYNRSETPLSLYVDQSQPQYLSAAATLLARMAVVAGKTIDTRMAATVGDQLDGDTLFVGRLSDMPPQVLKQFDIDPASRLAWGNPKGEALPQMEHAATAQTLSRWKQQLSGHGWSLLRNTVEEWLNRNFDISMDSLGLSLARRHLYAPPPNTTMFLAQQNSPNGAGTWTMAAAPSGDLLQSATDKLAYQADWSRLSGRISAMTRSGSMTITRASGARLLETQPPSLSNYRLIAANWLSNNPFLYGTILFIACIVLGVVTEAFFSFLGRRSR